MIAITMFAVSCDNKPVEPKEYTVTFETGTESKIEAVKVEEGKTVARPKDPENSGMVLVGWYLGEVEYDFTTPVKADITLKAIWGKGVATIANLKAEITAGTPIICLTEDITLTEDLSIDNGQDIKLDLNGKNLVLGNNAIYLSSDNYKGTSYKGASLSIIGQGAISSTKNVVFNITGSHNAEKDSKINLSLGKDVIVESTNTENDASVIAVFPGWDGETETNNCYNVTVDIYGKIKGKQPVYVNGLIINTENASLINIHENAQIDCIDDSGIYIAGYSNVAIGKDAVINSTANAISIASGKLEINGAILTGGNKGGVDPGFGGSISSNTGSAVFVKQHTTNNSLEVVINDGKFNAFIPLYQHKGQHATPKPDKVKLSIKGGEFTCTSEESVKITVQSEDKTGFISGGIFSVAPATKYIADGYEAKATGTNWTVVKIAE